MVLWLLGPSYLSNWLAKNLLKELAWPYHLLMDPYFSVRWVKLPLHVGIHLQTNKSKFIQQDTIVCFLRLFFILYRVLAFDTEQLQFVADIRTPSRDAGSIYILSSRFHRFFLKNLNPLEFNTRILRIDGGTNNGVIPLSGFPGQQIAHGSNFGQIFHNQQQATSPPKPTTYVESFFNSIRQPYPYEPVGIINKHSSNPFASLNTGERPDSFGKQQTRPLKFGLHDSSLYGNVQPNFNDFNGLRIAKSATYNTSLVH